MPPQLWLKAWYRLLVVNQKYMSDINVIYSHRYIALILKHFVALKYIDTALKIMNANVAQNFLNITKPMAIVGPIHPPSLCFFMTFADDSWLYSGNEDNEN